MTTAPIGESLLPCPFCDYVSEVKASPLERWFSVHCQQCRVTTKQYQTMTEAVAIWNRRSAPAALDEVARLRRALEKYVDSCQRCSGHGTARTYVKLGYEVVETYQCPDCADGRAALDAAKNAV